MNLYDNKTIELSLITAVINDNSKAVKILLSKAKNVKFALDIAVSMNKIKMIDLLKDNYIGETKINSSKSILDYIK